jgi:hypothetical protein
LPYFTDVNGLIRGARDCDSATRLRSMNGRPVVTILPPRSASSFAVSARGR